MLYCANSVVTPTGVACDHHFNPHLGSENFLFCDGQYRMEVFAITVGRKRATIQRGLVHTKSLYEFLIRIVAIVLTPRKRQAGGVARHALCRLG